MFFTFFEHVSTHDHLNLQQSDIEARCQLPSWELVFAVFALRLLGLHLHNLYNINEYVCNIHMYVHMWIYVCIIYICMYVRVYIYIYVNVHSIYSICMYIYIHMHMVFMCLLYVWESYEYIICIYGPVSSGPPPPSETVIVSICR